MAAALAVVATVSACGSGEAARERDVAADVLLLDGQEPLACGMAPLSALSEEPGAERADTPEAAALRGVLETGIAGMSFPPRDDWVVLQREAELVTFGHREGPVGIDHVVSVKRDGDRWGFGGSGGCGPMGYADGREAGHSSWYTEQEGGIALDWIGGQCDEQVEPVVQVAETPTTVQLLFVPPAQASGSCNDAGVSRSTVVPLEAPVGERRVENVGFLPVRVIPSQAEYEAEQAAEAAAMEQSRAWCAEAAAILGGTPQVDYPTDVATVRRHVPDAVDAWAVLDDADPAAHCYLERPDGETWSFVTAPTVEPLVIGRDRRNGGTYFRLGDEPDS